MQRPKQTRQRLLILGCGDVVRRILPQLARRFSLIALVRQIDPELRRFKVRQICGDLDTARGSADYRTGMARIAGLAHCVVHSVPPATLDGTDVSAEVDQRTRRIVAALRRGGQAPRRLVYISSSGVYGDCGGRRVAETSAVQPESARAKRRLDAERSLREFGRRCGCKVNLLRAPGIYASDRLPLARIKRGEPVCLAAEDSYSNHIHADDLARACLAALQRGRPNRSYNICDDSPLKIGDWLDLLADCFCLPKPPRLPRAEVERQASPLTWSFLRESRRLDNARMKRELRLRLNYADVAVGLAALAAPKQRDELDLERAV